MNINQEGVQQVLALHLLELLDAQSLALLSCTSQQMRSLVYGASLDVWIAASRARLPGACSLPDPCTRVALQRALGRYNRALHGIRRCGWSFTTLSWSFPEPQFNSNGSHLACFIGNSIRIRDAITGRQEVDLYFGDQREGWLRFRWGHEGTLAGIVLCSQVPLPHTNWVWEQFDGPQWSPDLTKLLIQEVPESADEAPLTKVIDALTGALVWSSQARMPVPPQWRPDGKAVLFFSGDPELGLAQHTEQVVSITDHRTLWWATLDHGNLAAAGAAVNTHAFSPNGQLICTTFPITRTAKIMRISDGMQVMLMEGEGQNALMPASVTWAPDSAHVAACCASNGNPHPAHDALLGIWLIGRGRILTLPLGELVVSEPEVVINGVPIVQWSLDTKHLAIFVPTGSPHDCISIVSMEAHAPVCVMRASAFALSPEFSLFEMAWSPDASQLVVSFVHQRALDNGANGANGNGGHDFASAFVCFVEAGQF